MSVPTNQNHPTKSHGSVPRRKNAITDAPNNTTVQRSACDGEMRVGKGYNTARFAGQTVLPMYLTYAIAAFAKRNTSGAVVMFGMASRCAKSVATIDGTMHNANGTFSNTRRFTLPASIRWRGQKSSRRRTKGVVTSIGFAMSP